MLTFTEADEDQDSGPPPAPAPDPTSQYVNPAPAIPAQPAQDPSAQAGMLNLPAHMRTTYQASGGVPKFEDINPPMGNLGRTLIRLTGGNYERDYALQKQFYEQRQAQIESEKAQRAALLAQADTNIEKAIWATPPGQRKGILGVKQRFYEQQGIKIDPAIIDWYNKADDDERNLGAAAVKLIAQQYPQIDQTELMKYLYSNPAGVAKVLGTVAELQKTQAETQKLQAEAKSKDTESKFLEGALPALQGLQGGTSPQGGLPGPTQPQRAPQASQGPSQGSLSPVMTRIAQEAQAQGVDPAFALAIADTESGFQPRSGDGGQAAGYFQLHEPAAIDAAKALGMKPEDRFSPEGNIRLGVQYAKQLLQRGQSPAGALALYNWGTPTFQGKGNPQYVAQGMQKYGQYSNMLGGRPATQAQMMSSSDYQQRIADLNQEIANYSQALKKMVGIKASPRGSSIYEGLESQQKAAIAERDSLLKQTETKPVDDSVSVARALGLPPNPNEWTQEQAAAHAEAMANRKLAISKAQGQGALENEVIGADMARKVPGAGAGTTKAQLAEMEKNKPGSTQPIAELPETVQRQMTGWTTSYRLSTKLIDQLDDPQKLAALKPVIGGLLSDPYAWYQRAITGRMKGLTEAQQEFAADLALQIVQLRKEFLGTAQTSGELAAAQPFITDLSSATAGTIRAKLRAIRNFAKSSHDTARETAMELGQRAPKALPEPQEKKAESPGTQPDTEEGGPPPGQPPRKRPNPLREALQ